MKEYSTERRVVSNDGDDSIVCLTTNPPKSMFPTLRNSVSARLLCLVTLAATTGLGWRAQADFAYTAVDYPGAVYTAAEGINPQGEIVGIYIDTEGVRHGFVLRKSEFKSIDYPGVTYTEARGINPGGDIVGTYRLPGEGPLGYHGFVLSRNGDFTSVDFPGHLNTIAQRILPDGSVMGCYHDNDFMTSMHGFVLNSAGYTGFDVPNSMHNGATPDLGQIAGLFFDMALGRSRAYVLQNGNFNPFDFPGSIGTSAWDMNPSGAVVGNYTDGAGAGHGFLMRDGQFTSLDFPDAHVTAARGINPRGDIVGWYVDAKGNTHGFVASPER